MKNFERELDIKRREFSKWFTFSILGIFLFYIILAFLIKDMQNQPFALPKSVLVIGFITAAYISFLISKTRFNFITIYRIILLSILFLITYISMLLCDIAKTIYLLYIPVVLMVMLLSSFRKTIYFAFFIFLLCFFISRISNFFQIALDKDLYKNNPDALHFQEYLVVAIVAYFTFLILYYHLEFNKIKSKYSYLQELIFSENQEYDFQDIVLGNHTNENLQEFISTQNTDDDIINENTKEDKLEDLYEKIIQCLESEKPYQSPRFNIRILAEMVNSNTSYVSAALNKVGNRKFNLLVNEYRIKQVVEELKNDVHQKFTIVHIYTNAGFSQQSTFNRIFKEQTGSTPSEYIKNPHQQS